MKGNIQHILTARADDLAKRINRLRAELGALELEHNQCLTAIQAVASLSPEPKSPGFRLPAPTASMTMKGLIRKALKEEFPDGATAQQLLEHFHAKWNRTDIKRESLSPQLSRLRVDREVELRDGTLWRLRPRGNPPLSVEPKPESKPETKLADDPRPPAKNPFE